MFQRPPSFTQEEKAHLSKDFWIRVQEAESSAQATDHSGLLQEFRIVCKQVSHLQYLQVQFFEEDAPLEKVKEFYRNLKVS